MLFKLSRALYNHGIKLFLIMLDAFPTKKQIMKEIFFYRIFFIYICYEGFPKILKTKIPILKSTSKTHWHLHTTFVRYTSFYDVTHNEITFLTDRTYEWECLKSVNSRSSGFYWLCVFTTYRRCWNLQTYLVRHRTAIPRVTGNAPGMWWTA